MSYITAPFDFLDILSAAADPCGFMAECDHALSGRIVKTAAAIARNARQKPVVLLAGPSGSGKTTAAGKLAQELLWMGIRAHVVHMDDYFLTVAERNLASDGQGNNDYESPACMDLPLLAGHFSQLCRGEEVLIPSFDFPNQRRAEGRGRPLRLGSDEVAIFEGIHALNPIVLGEDKAAERETRLYVSARANIRKDGYNFFKGTWIRLVRRLIRDNNFRGVSAQDTLRLWGNVRRGEKRYISPYKGNADMVIDTALGYELSAVRDYALPLFAHIPDDADRAAELRQIAPALREFPPLPMARVNKRSIIREFIGDGVL